MTGSFGGSILKALKMSGHSQTLVYFLDARWSRGQLLESILAMGIVKSNVINFASISLEFIRVPQVLKGFLGSLRFLQFP